MNRESWIDYVYKYMDAEYERLCELEVKIAGDLLMDIAIHALYDSESQVKTIDVHAKSGKPYFSLINYNFVYRYRQWSSLVPRKKCGKKSLSRTSEIRMKKIAYHLGDMYKAFQ